MFGQPRHAAINATLNDCMARCRPLIAVHRGTGLGVVVENTARALQAALRLGADMVEIDIVESTDGDFFLFHEGYEPLHFGTEPYSIKQMSSAEIRQLRYQWHSSRANPTRVAELGDVLTQFKGGPLFNVDRSWWYWPRLLGFLDQFDMADQLILKSPVTPAALAALAAHPVKYPFAPMVETMAEVEQVLGSGDEVNVVGFELLADTPSHEFADPAVIASLHARGAFCFMNAIVLGDDIDRFAGWDDNVSMFGDCDNGWGKLMELGADVIQTDWPSPLAAYRRAWQARAAQLPATRGC